MSFKRRVEKIEKYFESKDKSRVGISDSFTTSELTKITGITRSCLQQWTEREYIKPSIQSGNGQGTRCLYSFDDVCQVAVFKKLISAGVKREAAAVVASMVVNDSSGTSLLLGGHVSIGFQGIDEFKERIIEKAKQCKNA